MAVTWSAADAVREVANAPEQEPAVERMHAAAVLLVERYAPSAPPAVQNEAAARTLHYLFQRESSDQILMGDAGLQASFAAGAVSALRNSGGMSLLSPWKIRRAL